jgi:hypothetical protein
MVGNGVTETVVEVSGERWQVGGQQRRLWAGGGGDGGR